MARPGKLPKILTEEETDRLLSQPNQRYFGPHRDHLYMRLMLKAGLRASEATALRPEVQMRQSRYVPSLSCHRSTRIQHCLESTW